MCPQLASIHSELENRIATLMLQYAYGGDDLEVISICCPRDGNRVKHENINLLLLATFCNYNRVPSSFFFLDTITV